MSAESIATGIESGVSSVVSNPGVQHLGLVLFEGVLFVGAALAAGIYIRNRFRNAMNS